MPEWAGPGPGPSRWRDRQDRRSRGRDMRSPLHTRWTRREATRVGDDKRSTRAPESCGWRAASAAKPLGGPRQRGAREDIRVRPAARTPRSRGDRVSARKRLWAKSRALPRPRFQVSKGKQGDADAKPWHKAVRLEAGRERDEDKPEDRED